MAFAVQETEVNMKNIFTVAASVIAAVAMTFAFETTARATTYQGLCMTNYASTCARENAGYVDSWPQDISGDTYQHYAREYIGQVSASGCWPFTCGSGLNSTFNGESVWVFLNVTTANCIDMEFSGNQATAQACGPFTHGGAYPGQMFSWTSSGELVNVYQSDYYGSGQFLMGQGAGNCLVYEYVPLVTWNGAGRCTTTWTMRNGS